MRLRGERRLLAALAAVGDETDCAHHLDRHPAALLRALAFCQHVGCARGRARDVKGFPSPASRWGRHRLAAAFHVHLRSSPATTQHVIDYDGCRTRPSEPSLLCAPHQSPKQTWAHSPFPACTDARGRGVLWRASSDAPRSFHPRRSDLPLTGEGHCASETAPTSRCLLCWPGVLAPARSHWERCGSRAPRPDTAASGARAPSGDAGGPRTSRPSRPPTVRRRVGAAGIAPRRAAARRPSPETILMIEDCHVTLISCTAYSSAHSAARAP